MSASYFQMVIQRINRKKETRKEGSVGEGEEGREGVRKYRIL